MTERVEQTLNHVEIAAFIARADVVNTAGPAVFQSHQDGATMVLDVNPIAHVHAVTINRNGFAVHCIRQGQRQKLLGKLPWTIVVAREYDPFRCQTVVCCGTVLGGRL